MKALYIMSLAAIMTANAVEAQDAPWADSSAPYVESQESTVNQAPPELHKIQSLRGGDRPSEGSQEGDTLQAALTGGLRQKTVRSEAISTGMKAGLAFRYRQIEAVLRSQSTKLSIIFDFSNLLIDGVVLPPVLTVDKDERREYTDNSARSTQVVYKIAYPSRLVTVPPQWQDFLLKGYRDPPRPAFAILPKDEDEAKIWEDGVAEGWRMGIMQANAIYRSSLALLKTTLEGMLNYDALLKEGVVSKPILSKKNLGIVFQGKELDVGDTVYTLAAQPEFREPQDWRPKPRDETQVVFPH